jgi:hypothetical protein
MGTYGSIAYGLIGRGGIDRGSIGSGLMEGGGGATVPLSLWHQIEGGQDLGASINGGSDWFWPNPVPATFQAVLLNIEDTAFDAAQAFVEGVTTGTSTLTGWGLNVQSAWNLDTSTTNQGNGGSMDSPAAALSAVLPLSAPLNPGAYFTLQQRRSTGNVAGGKCFASGIWPESGQVAGQAFQEGDRLGLSVTGIGIGPLTSRLFLRRAVGANPYYNFMVFGDSTTAQVRPLAASNNTAKEGVWHFANANLRTNGKRVRIYSGGQGGASWTQIKARVRAALPWLAGKVSHIVIQVWTWNSAWGSANDANAAWAEYLVLEAEVIAAGFACSPLILNPYTTRNSAGEIAGFAALKAATVAHPRGIVLDTIMGSTSWPNLVPAESEDNIHSNRDGGFRAGPLAAPIFLTRAAEYYPALA